MKPTIKTTCSKCGKPLEAERLGRFRYCKSCHAEYMRDNRPKHSELNEIQRKKANARAYLKEYVKRGVIIKECCEICGSCDNVEGHHENYDDPLEVRWLCRIHHLEYHKING